MLGEAMKPFLEYGWQPQIMAVQGRQKAIFAGPPSSTISPPTRARRATWAAARTFLRPCARPSTTTRCRRRRRPASPAALSAEDRQKLASLGYVSATAAPVVRKDAPRPADMVRLFDALEEASTLFVQAKYAQVIPLLERILAEDRYNLDATLRLATAHSTLGHERARRSRRSAGQASSRRSRTTSGCIWRCTTRAARTGPRPCLRSSRLWRHRRSACPPSRASRSSGSGRGRLEEAVDLLWNVYELRTPTAAELVRLGEMAMEAGRTDAAIDAFERARSAQGPAFRQDLELGVLYLSARRFEDARAALDRVPSSHPAYPMALFKRAQVSVLLREPDAAARIEQARRRADATTRELIAGRSCSWACGSAGRAYSASAWTEQRARRRDRRARLLASDFLASSLEPHSHAPSAHAADRSTTAACRTWCCSRPDR